MSRDDIIRMAREAGFPFNKFGLLDADELFERFAALVAAHEREECAKVCDEKASGLLNVKRTNQVDRHVADVLQGAAAAIRQRGNP